MNALVNFAQKGLKNVFKFHGGVHPPGNKTQSTQLPIARLPLPDKLVLPLRQHVGNLPKLKVAFGDKVLKGQLLAEAEGMVSAAIHAPTSGTISAIEDAMIPHPSGLPDKCITLVPDGRDEWIAHAPTDWRSADRKEIIAHLRNSGIVGFGGATFPSHIKLRADGKSSVHTLIINAAECEPYITCDDMLMRERASEIVQGIQIALRLLGAEQAVIGIEDNKPEAAKAMEAAIAGTNIQLKVVPTLYPSGDARRLIYLLTGTEIPHDQRTTEVGLQVFNVATVLALHRYLDHGEPALSRIVSVTGNVAQAQNFEVLFGTSLHHLIHAAGGTKAGTTHYIMGGPMMGFKLPSDDVPITKAANCIIASAPDLFAPPPAPMPCIRCARCADACPVSLQPQELYWFAKSDNFEKARDYQLFDCIECGACAYVCPSNIPLVQYYRYAKSEIIAADRAKEAADLARQRNEFRLQRIEREKQERAAKHAERAQGAKSAETTAPEGKQDAASSPAISEADAAKKAAIAAAIERAKAAKAAAAAAGEAPKNTEPASNAVKQEIAEIDARRKAVGLEGKQEAASGDALKTIPGKPMPEADAEKQAKIAAAIERAKAAKAAAESAKAQAGAENSAKVTSAPSATPVADAEKQAKIAAAIERAKAAKAAADAAKKENS